MAWSFVLTDLFGNQLGELNNANTRKVDLPHLGVPSASCVIPIDHPLATTVSDSDTLLKCYRIDGPTGARSLAFHGPVVTVEENGAEGVQTMAITAAGPYWRLSRRIIPGSKTLTSIAYPSQDLGLTATQILADCNAADFTGIVAGTVTPSITGGYKVPALKVASEAIAELASGLSSFEFRVDPSEATPYANPRNWPRIGVFTAAPLLGVNRPDAIFEYGTPRANVASYTKTTDRTTLVNNAIISVSGWPDGVDKNPDGSLMYDLIQRGSPASHIAHGLFEEVVPDNGVLDNELRAAIADYHLAVRKNPKQTITITPAVNARPAPFIDYLVGDNVRFRAVASGTIRFDVTLRIWGVTFDIDSNGNENVTLSLTQTS